MYNMYVYTYNTCRPEWPAEPIEVNALPVASKSRVLFVAELFYYTLTRPSVVAALFHEQNRLVWWRDGPFASIVIITGHLSYALLCPSWILGLSESVCK